MLKKLHSMMGHLLKVHEYLCEGCFWVGGVLLFIMVFTTTFDVTMRYIFARPTPWSIDFAEYAIMYSAFLAAAWLLKTDNHVKITVIQEKLGTKARLKLDLFNSIIGAVACTLLTWQGVLDTWDTFTQGALITRSITIPKWTIFWIIPFGLFLFDTYFIRNIFSLMAQIKQMDGDKE